MLFLKGLLITLGAGLALAGLVALAATVRRRGEARPGRGRLVLSCSAGSLLLLSVGMGLVVVPAGRAAVRVSQISGIRPGTLGPGVHFVLPLLEEAAVYDVREHVLATVTAADPKARGEALRAQTKEGSRWVSR
jgi:hypothetical protein